MDTKDNNQCIDLNIGKAINHFLNEFRMNQTQFAVKCGMSRSMITYLINSKRAPSIRTLQKISSSCDVKLSEFIRAAE